MQINYITKELFYEHPKECLELLTSGTKNKKISFRINDAQHDKIGVIFEQLPMLNNYSELFRMLIEHYYGVVVKYGVK